MWQCTKALKRKRTRESSASRTEELLGFSIDEGDEHANDALHIGRVPVESVGHQRLHGVQHLYDHFIGPGYFFLGFKFLQQGTRRKLCYVYSITCDLLKFL